MRKGVLCRREAARKIFLVPSPEIVVLKIHRKEVKIRELYTFRD